MIFPSVLPVPEIEIRTPELDEAGVRLMVRREDLNHPTVSGNKYWKLKYNLLEAQRKGYDKVLTFGGAFSNHIAATAAAGRLCGLQSVGVVRGEEADLNNPTLSKAMADGMLIHAIPRDLYKEKTSESFLEMLRKKFGDFYLVPEGGTNALAIEGVKEMMSNIQTPFDYLALPVGTGGTISGCIQALAGRSTILGFASLRGGFLAKEIDEMHRKYLLPEFSNWKMIDGYHFGGYGKSTASLLNFMEAFEQDHQIPLDPIYTGKMFWGLLDMIRSGKLERGTSVLALHTGGLQGRQGFGLQG